MVTAPATVIREAQLEDVPAIVAMGLRFLSSAPYGGLLTPEPVAMAAFTERLIASPDAAWLVAERGPGVLIGMLALFLYAHPFSGQSVANELCWWMEPEFRGSRAALRLLDRAESWARQRGATVLQMIAPDQHVEDYYKRTGFQRTEVHYQRAIA